MTFWIDVEDANGTRLGDGPITTAVNWDFTSQLDKAGAFSFSMPKDDPRAALLLTQRTVKAWGYEGGTVRGLGAGVIQEIQTTVGEDGRAMLTVSGGNLLAELLKRIIPLETFNEQVILHPAAAGYYNIGLSTFGSRYQWIDLDVGDTTTYANDNGYGCILVQSPYIFDRAIFTVHSSSPDGDHNGSIAEYWNGSSWTPFTVYVNTTTVDGDWFGQSGYIEWLAREIDWPADPDPNYMIRFRADSAGWIDFELSDVALRVSQPTDDALNQIMAYAPDGWTLDAVNGYTATQPRPLGSTEKMANGGFETYSGTPNDTTTDSWTSWTAYETPEHFAYVLAITSDKHGGAACVKLTTESTYGMAYIEQLVTVEPATEYTLSYWTKGDGDQGQLACALYAPDIEHCMYYADALVTAATWTRVTVTFTTPFNATAILVRFRNPGVLTSFALLDDVSLRMGGGAAIMLDSVGETVLENLIRVAETTGEHFILGDGRLVLWLGKDERSSGMRAIADVDAVAVEGAADVCLIKSLAEVVTGTGLCSRVYPYGGGSEPIPTLRNTTRVAPPGYTLDKAHNYLKRDAAETAYGRIERRLDVPDVTNMTGNFAGDVHSCNMLFDRALLWLERHSATDLTDGGDAPRTFNIELVKCDAVLRPGYSLRVEYDRYVAGVRTMHVAGDFWILASTLRADAGGIHTVAVQCSNVDIAPVTDAGLLVDMLRQQRAAKLHGG